MHAFPLHTYSHTTYRTIYTPSLHVYARFARKKKKKKHTKALLWWPLTQPSAVSSRVGASKGCEVM